MDRAGPAMRSTGRPEEPPDEGRLPLGCVIGLLLLLASPGLISVAVIWPILNPRWKPLALSALAGLTILFIAVAWLAGAFGRRRRDATPNGPHPDGERLDR